jgi:acetoacetyl-CoA synthetase
MPTEPLWRPSAARIADARLTHFLDWLQSARKLAFADYEALWTWSVEQQEAFWGSVWDYFDIPARRPYRSVRSAEGMPATRWFEGAELNFVDQIFRHRALPGPALMFESEAAGAGEITWSELERQVAALAATLRRLGVGAGDRVIGYLCNIPPAVVGLLACASIGAIWSITAPDMGPLSVIDRFKQISPKILIACDGYVFAGTAHDRRAVLRSIVSELPTLEAVIWVEHLRAGPPQLPPPLAWLRWSEAIAGEAALNVAAVAASHPLWILYSSGTTGLPKAIVHGHAGMLIQGLLGEGIHLDLKAGERVFWNTSTSWMIWNTLVSGLLLGATLLLYDGAPSGSGAQPDRMHLWRLMDSRAVNFFGAGAAFYHACLKAAVTPCALELRALKSVASTGSPLSTDGYRWLSMAVKSDLWINSTSGGTDICGAFTGGVPTLPVYAGEMQCRILGASVASFSESGRAQIGAVGELVCTRPLPSMPLYFWGDQDNRRYLESYFERFSDADGQRLWAHGDWLKLVPRPGAVGAVIYGRSDATINRHGVRMGTSELYRAVESFSEIAESMVVDLEYLGRESYMALFIVLRPDATLTAELDARLRQSIRSAMSPRHVPNEILSVPDIPKTITGKKLEVPIKKLLLGFPLEQVISRDALANPASLEWYVQFAAARLSGA